MTDEKESPSALQVGLLAFASTLGPLATNGIVPSFIDLSKTFGVALTDMQLTLTIYLLAFALGSLVVGAISDTCGRCRTLACGMILFAASTVFIVSAKSLFELNCWRFMQGLGASVGQVVTQAMVRDRWSGYAATKVMSVIGMLFSISPAFAPVIGGWCVFLFDWKAVFWFLFIYSSLIAFIALVGLKESLPPEQRKPLLLAPLIRCYGESLKNKAFLFGILSNGISLGGMLLVVAGGADFVVHVMGLNVNEFAWLSFPVVSTAILGTYMTPGMVKRFGRHHFITILFSIVVVSEIILYWIYRVVEPTYLLLLLAPVAFQFFAAMARPAVMVMNLDYMPERRGLAASVQQSFMTGGFCLSSSVLAPLCAGEAWKYAVGMGVAALLCAVFWALSVHYRPRYLPKECARREKISLVVEYD